MNGSIVEIQLQQFVLVYLLLLDGGCHHEKVPDRQTKLLIVASLRMSVQLVIAGFIPHDYF